MKHILFDLDGVLIHTSMWSTEFIRIYSLPPDAMQDFFLGVFRECTIGKADLREILPEFLERWWYEKWGEDFLREWFDYENHPDKELIEKIQELRTNGVKCYVATNQEKYRLAYLKYEMYFENLFDGIFCSAEIGYKKPEKEYYQYIIDTLMVAPSDILYFDDALENIEAAHSLGIHARLYRSISDFSIE